MAIIRIVRKLVYEGDERWMRPVLERCAIQPDRMMRIPYGTIREEERYEVPRCGKLIHCEDDVYSCSDFEGHDGGCCP